MKLAPDGDSDNSFLQSETDNKDLQALFMYCFGDYGTSPDKAGFPMQGTLLGHFMNGESPLTSSGTDCKLQVTEEWLRWRWGQGKCPRPAAAS